MKQPPRYQTQPTDAPPWASEPFRLFFPLGISASIFGVLIWPLFYSGNWSYPPQIQHPRLMIFGFGFAFITGFLGTAWPRFLEARALNRTELLLLAGTWLGAQLFYSFFRIPTGDLLFGIHALSLLAILSLRLGRGRELPPPGFSLAFSSVVLASAIGLTWAAAPTSLPPKVFLFTKLIAYQGLLLLPLMGIGSYLFARVFVKPGERPSTTSPRKRNLGVWLGAIAVLLSFIAEVNLGVRCGNLVRFAAFSLWAFITIPFVFTGRAPSTRAWGLRVALASIAIAFLWRSISPGPGYAVAHVLFISGFGLAMLLMADRVTLGHADPLNSKPRCSKLWRWLVWLILLAAATRVSADFKASILISHHIYAALLWTIITGIWTVALGRYWTGGFRVEGLGTRS